MRIRRKLLAFCIGLFIAPALFYGTGFVYAQSEVERLQSQIAERNNRLSEIEKEIAQYEAALQEVGAEKSTLQKAINELELERKKVQADIKYTENKISSTDLEINKLTLEISATEKDIAQNEAAIKRILRSINVADEESMIELLLRYDNLSEFWNALEELDTVRNSMSERVRSLSLLKEELESKRLANAEHRSELLNLKDQYSDQHGILTNNSATKAELLSATKNEEAEYQKLLKAKQEAREQLMAEVRDIESQIQFILDPSTIPSAGTAVFRWPVDNPYITQYFGYTKFAHVCKH